MTQGYPDYYSNLVTYNWRTPWINWPWYKKLLCFRRIKKIKRNLKRMTIERFRNKSVFSSINKDNFIDHLTQAHNVFDEIDKRKSRINQKDIIGIPKNFDVSIMEYKK